MQHLEAEKRLPTCGGGAGGGGGWAEARERGECSIWKPKSLSPPHVWGRGWGRGRPGRGAREGRMQHLEAEKRLPSPLVGEGLGEGGARAEAHRNRRENDACYNM